MNVDVIVPAAGESIKEGEIKQWYKASGDPVKMDEPLLSLETDKATLEVTAPAAGTLTVLAPAGETVKVGAVIGRIEPASAKIAEGTSTPPSRSAAAGHASSPSVSTSRPSVAPTVGAGQPKIASPAARKLMAEDGLQGSPITGSAKGGRITKADVLKFKEERSKPAPTSGKSSGSKSKLSEALKFYESDAPVISPDETIVLYRQPPKDDMPGERLLSEVSTPAEPPPQVALPSSGEGQLPPMHAETSVMGHRQSRREKISRIRKTIAKRLVDAKQVAALLTTFNEVDMSAIVDIRQKYREEFKKNYQTDLSFMSFFTKAACQALKAYPIINAYMDENDVVHHDYCDIGIAIATDKGLVVPVIRNAESLTFAEIEKAIASMADKARKSQLSLDDLTGGTFTITNGGVFGSMLSTPIVNPPQSAILGMHTIIKRPVAKDDQVVIRPMMYVALTYDHRLIDGADAVKFLVKVKQLCEEPLKLLLNV